MDHGRSMMLRGPVMMDHGWSVVRARSVAVVVAVLVVNVHDPSMVVMNTTASPVAVHPSVTSRVEVGRDPGAVRLRRDPTSGVPDPGVSGPGVVATDPDEPRLRRGIRDHVCRGRRRWLVVDVYGLRRLTQDDGGRIDLIRDCAVGEVGGVGH